MDITEVSIIHHIGIVMVLLWILSYYSCCYPLVYFISLVYLYQVHERYIMRLHKKLQFEERKQANQKRLLSDSETVRWLNYAVEKVWPICMEHIMSQKILLPIVPWFLEKYKPWAAKKAVVQHLYLGRNPPIFTNVRVHRQSSDDDHLVLELGMNFLTAEDMSTILSVKLRKRLGFGIWAKLHVTGMHVEGKVLVGVKFLREWPFLGRLRVCFVEPPYFQMTVKPIVNHGLDVTEIPGIAGWLDKLLAAVFEQTLVEPNMLVVDMEKFASADTENWFSVDEKDPIAYVKVEIVEAADIKPSDSNGLADPYVKGQLGPYRFQTKIQKKTLAPNWQEEFKIPICTWESPNELALEVCDKDHFVDDTLGDCSINISDLRGGQRHDMWLPLQNKTTGRLHLAVTVLDIDAKEVPHIQEEKSLNKKESTNSIASDTAEKGSDSTICSENAPKMAGDFDPINIEGQKQTGIWVHHPGSDVSQIWEPRKRKSRHADIQIHSEDNDSTDGPYTTASGSNQNGNSSSDENEESKRLNALNKVRRSLHKIGSVFHWGPRKEDHCISKETVPSPRVNLLAVNERGTAVKLIVDDDILAGIKGSKADEGLSPVRNEVVSPSKGNMKDMAKSILKHVLSRKGSDKYKGDSESASTEIEDQGSDSSDEGSLSASMQCGLTVEGIPTDSAPVFGHGAESPNHKEHNIQVGACDSTATGNIEDSAVREVSCRGEERDTTSLSEVCGEGLTEECLKTKIPEGNFEAEKT